MLELNITQTIYANEYTVHQICDRSLAMSPQILQNFILMIKRKSNKHTIPGNISELTEIQTEFRDPSFPKSIKTN